MRAPEPIEWPGRLKRWVFGVCDLSYSRQTERLHKSLSTTFDERMTAPRGRRSLVAFSMVQPAVTGTMDGQPHRNRQNHENTSSLSPSNTLASPQR